MSSAVEDMRYLQAGCYSGEFRRHIEPFPPNPFLDSLDTRQVRPPSDEIGEVLDIAILKPKLQEIYRIAEQPGWRGESYESTINGRQETVIFSAANKSRHTLATDTDGVIEAGQNYYLNPYDTKIYDAPPAWVNYTDFPMLYDDLNMIAQEGFFTTLTVHSHPPEFLAFPSISDSFIFPVKRQEEEEVPLVNAQIILGYMGETDERVQVLALRTAESQTLLPDDEVIDERNAALNLYENVGGNSGRKWRRKIQSLQGTKSYRKEKAKYDAYFHSERTALEVEVARQMQVKYFVSTDMELYRGMSPEDIMQMVGIPT